MSFISVLDSIGAWFKKVFISHTQSADSIAVTITETIKTLLANPVTDFLANIADAITKTQVPTEIVSLLNAGIIKVLAVELGIQGLPPNPTPAQILAFEQAVMTAFNVKSNNSKLYTELGAQIFGIIQTNIANGTTKFSDWVIAVEKAYADYQQDLAANAVVQGAPPTATPTEPSQPVAEVLPN